MRDYDDVQSMEDITSPLDLFKWDYREGFIDGKHIRLIDKYLMKFVDKDIDNLAVFIPPRHGKSMMCSVYLPAFIQGLYSNVQIIQCSATKTLAEGFTQKSRDLVDILGLYPLDPSVQRKDEYALQRPRRGRTKGIGTGTNVTGYGADILIIDDMISTDNIFTTTMQRQKLEEYYRSTLSTRRMPGSQTLLIMTRWSMNDISQTIVDDEDDWTTITLPAFCTDINAPWEEYIKRDVGDALWPEFWPASELEKQRKRVGNFYFSAQFQCDPKPPQGLMLDSSKIDYYWRVVDVNENAIPRDQKHRVMCADLAYGETTRHDETTCTIVDLYQGHYYVEKQFAWRKDTDYTTHQLAKLYNYYSPNEFYVETIGFQHMILKSLQKQNIPVMPFEDRRHKEVKIGELAPFLDSQMIHLKTPETDWSELVEQIQMFPSTAVHDDRVEGLWMCISKLQNAGNPYSEWDGENAYEFSNAGLHKKKQRPAVFVDTNYYSSSHW